jgi:hypothetical protein
VSHCGRSWDVDVSEAVKTPHETCKQHVLGVALGEIKVKKRKNGKKGKKTRNRIGCLSPTRMFNAAELSVVIG